MSPAIPAASGLIAGRRRLPIPATGEHHDLEALIGSWREDPEFDAAIRAFAQVDESVWK